MGRGLIIAAFTFCFVGLIGCSENSVDPILVLTANTTFGTYTGEILKAEGFNEFRMDSITNRKTRLRYLQKFDVIILAASNLTFTQREMIATYVKKGGNLIAVRPDKELSEIFGITYSGGTIDDGYIQITDTIEMLRGLTGKALQLHCQADKYILSGGTRIAALLADSVRNTGSPAVVYNRFKKGHCVAILYDLPENIIYTRQGNPALAGIEKDGINGLRSMDMFTDGWVKRSNNSINQADEQMRLLSHCIEKLSTNSKPLPRFWYFPGMLKCLITLTNDGESRNEDNFETQFRDIDSMGAKMTLYILDLKKVSKAWTDRWVARGHEIAGHPDDVREASSPSWKNMNNAIETMKAEIAGKYGLEMRTNVNHWFVWCGRDSSGNLEFASQAQLESNSKIEMDINYAHYDMNSNQGHFLGVPGTEQGNFTGSGLIMRFADSHGRILKIYQHLNNVYDQIYNERKDPDGFYNCFKGLMDRSLYNEVYSYISIKAHNDEYYFSKEPLLKMLSYANENGIPVWTAVKLLDFIKTKDDASFRNIRWKKNQLSFKLSSAFDNENGLTFMLPSKYGKLKIKRITRDGQDQTLIIRSVNGYDYAFVTVRPGVEYDFIAAYNLGDE